MIRLKCIFLIIILYWIVISCFYLCSINFNPFINSYKNSLDLNYSKKKSINVSHFSKHLLDMSRHHKEKQSTVYKFHLISHHIVKHSSQKAISVNSVISTKVPQKLILTSNVYPYSTIASNYKNFAAQHINEFNFLLSLKKSNLTELYSPSQSTIISKFFLTSTSQTILSSSPDPTTTLTNIRNSCHQFASLVEMVTKTNPLLHNYSNISILMEPIIQESDINSLFMLVGILSSAESQDMRDAVRETWGSNLLFSSFKR